MFDAAQSSAGPAAASAAVFMAAWGRSLSPITTHTDIKSSRGPFQATAHKTIYPSSVISGLGALVGDFNQAFGPLIARNREWDTDYQRCLLPTGRPANWLVQIDMVGLSDELLTELAGKSAQEARDTLSRHVFELENSMAMYQLLERLFPESTFSARYRTSLDELRRRFGKPVALLAVTRQKYDSMLEEELGMQAGQKASDETVKALTGFDCLMGPDEFKAHVEQNGGECRYLLYVRASDPVDKLKKPGTAVEHPLLSDPHLRRTIKANSLTINIDDPSWKRGDERCVNDSKAYMKALGIGFPIRDLSDALEDDLIKHMDAGGPFASFNGVKLPADLRAFLRSYGVEEEKICSGDVYLRAKPLQGAYGCYGHHRGRLGDLDFRTKLKKSTRDRGPYIVQPELEKSFWFDDGAAREYIDRVFFTCTSGRPRLLGGFRSYMPAETVEAKRGRNHGNGNVVWGQISDS